MTNLSPAALAVWHAYETADCDPYKIDPRQAGVAAALRAAADQLYDSPSQDYLWAIADELDNNAPTNQED
jgi:hypothetical protein